MVADITDSDQRGFIKNTIADMNLTKKNLADKHFCLTCKGSHVAERRFELPPKLANPHKSLIFRVFI